MDFNNGITYVKPYYKWFQSESIENMELYQKFVNWVSGEFDLYLQDESEGLKVFYPNGWINISTMVEINNSANLEITLVNKSKVVCERIMLQLLIIFEHVKLT